MVYSQVGLEFGLVHQITRSPAFFWTFRQLNPHGYDDAWPCFHAREVAEGTEDQGVWRPELLHRSLAVMRALGDDHFMEQYGLD